MGSVVDLLQDTHTVAGIALDPDHLLNMKVLRVRLRNFVHLPRLAPQGFFPFPAAMPPFRVGIPDSFHPKA